VHPSLLFASLLLEVLEVLIFFFLKFSRLLGVFAALLLLLQDT
jgi:hypothetical protein